jgi:tellurite resistance protein
LGSVSALSAASSPAAQQAFDYFPVALFGSVMGLSGLCIAWRIAHARYGAPDWIPTSIGAAAVIAFLLVTIGYAAKIATAPGAVKAEFNHPIAGNLFGTILISLLLLPIVVAPVSLPIARALWIAGATGMVAFALFIVNRWLSDRQQIAHATPAWIVPVVGMLDVPLALPSLGLPPMHELMVLALSVGLFFTLPLFTLIFSRLLFEPPMPESLQPTLMILVAPFAVGTSTYMVTTERTDLFAQALYLLTLFMLVALLGRLRYIARCSTFRFSWWAVSFPIAASAIAALRFAVAQPSTATDAVALLLLAFATLAIGGLLILSLIGVARGELRKLST